jgi:pyruvate dehydrogenase E2 component (dihydrolipoamide acetyltransferase)
MATEVKLPRLGQGMESGTIIRWLKSEGDAVRKREPLYELDTDKVTQEVEADTEGVLLKILVDAGEVGVGTTIAVIGAEGEDVPTPEPAAVMPADRSAQSGGVPAAAASAEPFSHESAGRVKASPLARRIARERSIDLGTIVGTGPDGRVVAQDVEHAPAHAATATPAGGPAVETVGEVEVIALTSTRRTIARRLSEAWTAPVFQLTAVADARRLVETREALVARLGDGEAKPTVNDVLVKLVAVALTRHRSVNATYTGEAVERHASAHVGMAVAAPSGLIVPVVRYAERLTILEIAAVRADLVGRARAGKLTLADLAAGTFTVSNLGMFDVDEFTAVLNPPQVAILAAGAIAPRPHVVDDAVCAIETMHLSLTCDHRAIDGADGAAFLHTLRAFVELPSLAL